MITLCYEDALNLKTNGKQKEHKHVGVWNINKGIMYRSANYFVFLSSKITPICSAYIRNAFAIWKVR